MAVGDAPAPDVAAGQGRADEAWHAVAELAHGVEEMRGGSGARVEGGVRGLEVGVGMAEGDEDAGRGEPPDLVCRDAFRGDGEKQRPHLR